jgi:hypothetical protein
LHYCPPAVVEQVSALNVGGAVATLLLAWRWALEDRERESRVLLVRGLREPTAGRVARALGRFGVRWLRHQVVLWVLVIVAALGGIALVLLNIPVRGPLP